LRCVALRCLRLRPPLASSDMSRFDSWHRLLLIVRSRMAQSWTRLLRWYLIGVLKRTPSGPSKAGWDSNIASRLNLFERVGFAQGFVGKALPSARLMLLHGLQSGRDALVSA
jgi:hypothetical protein